MAFGSNINRDPSKNPALAAQMAALSFKPQAFNQNPLAPVTPAPSGLIGANPFSQQASFGHLAGLSKSGPGSLLQPPPGQTGLGDKAILTANGTLGKKLFISG